jgi:hypothetical protein
MKISIEQFKRLLLQYKEQKTPCHAEYLLRGVSSMGNRVVDEVRTSEIGFLTEKGTVSFCSLGGVTVEQVNEVFEITDKGFAETPLLRYSFSRDLFFDHAAVAALIEKNDQEKEAKRAEKAAKEQAEEAEEKAKRDALFNGFIGTLKTPMIKGRAIAALEKKFNFRNEGVCSRGELVERLLRNGAKVSRLSNEFFLERPDSSGLGEKTLGKIAFEYAEFLKNRLALP